MTCSELGVGLAGDRRWSTARSGTRAGCPSALASWPPASRTCLRPVRSWLTSRMARNRVVQGEVAEQHARPGIISSGTRAPEPTQAWSWSRSCSSRRRSRAADGTSRRRRAALSRVLMIGGTGWWRWTPSQMCSARWDRQNGFRVCRTFPAPQISCRAKEAAAASEMGRTPGRTIR